jgi:hypothetical protein
LGHAPKKHIKERYLIISAFFYTFFGAWQESFPIFSGHACLLRLPTAAGAPAYRHIGSFAGKKRL